MPDIFIDTPVMPNVIADNVIRELDRYLQRTYLGFALLPSAYTDLACKLADRANKLYQNNTTWQLKVKRDPMYGRDYLYCFMRHWLSAEFLGTPIDKLIPASFKNGQEIRF